VLPFVNAPFRNPFLQRPGGRAGVGRKLRPPPGKKHPYLRAAWLPKVVSLVAPVGTSRPIRIFSPEERKQPGPPVPAPHRAQGESGPGVRRPRLRAFSKFGIRWVAGPRSQKKPGLLTQLTPIRAARTVWLDLENEGLLNLLTIPGVASPPFFQHACESSLGAWFTGSLFVCS